ncbi:MAG: type II secretion system protein [Pirellulales bacterium]
MKGSGPSFRLAHLSDKTLNGPKIGPDPALLKPARFAPRSAFTLTELLVVITIIAILTSLITVAAVNALRTAKQARITMEMQQISNALENFKNNYGSYPPNVFPLGSLNTNQQKKTAAQDLQRFMKKAFSRSTEFQINMSGAAPQRNGTFANDNLYPILNTGLSPAEALVFWLQGFSQDVRRPLTGTDLVNPTNVNDPVTFDVRQPLFEFDQSRIKPSLDESGNPRFVTLNRALPAATEVRIPLYQYFPPGSEQPLAYFDVSRRTPSQVATTYPTGEFFFNPTGSDMVVAMKKTKASASTNPTNLLDNFEYVEQGKFQLLHCGLDDIWGMFALNSQLNLSNAPQLIFPDGPFIGDIGDTLTSYTTGTLEEAQE